MTFQGPAHRCRAMGVMTPGIRCRTFGGMDRHVIRTNRQNQAFHSNRSTCWLNCSATPAVDMESHVERASGAAQRRRVRRLRAWQRHVRTAVQLALAEKLHHSACRTLLPGKKWMEQDAAQRGQTARARGLELESFPHCPLRGLRPPSPSGELPSLLSTPQLCPSSRTAPSRRKRRRKSERRERRSSGR